MINIIRKLALRQFKDKAFIKGTLECRVRRAGSDEWESLWERPVGNKVVDAGIAWIAYLLMSSTPTHLTHGAIGSGTTGPADDDTALETQLGDRVAAALSRITTTITNDTAKYIMTFTAAAPWAVTEYGTFTAATDGTMLNRVTFSVINLDTSDELEFTYKAQVQRA